MKHPMQPLLFDAHGVLRFKANKIVQHLLSTHPSVNLNTLARQPFTDDDRLQFAQLIGYSLSGYASLSRGLAARTGGEVAGDAPERPEASRLKGEQ